MVNLATAKNAAITAKVRIIPVAMVTPNSQGIYAPSHIRQAFYTDRYKLETIKDYSRTILVSFAEDGISDPQPIRAYGYGWYCWFIAVED